MSAPRPDIRLAEPADAPAIAAMLARLADHLGETAGFSTTPEIVAKHGFGPKAAFSSIIAGPSSAPLGLALFFRHFSTLRGAPGAYVQDLWVAPEARGQRLGPALLAAVSAHAGAAWGARYIALTVHETNPDAARFYTRLGFESHPGARLMVLGGAGFENLTPSESPA